jgi:hypothetical protein
MPTARAYLAAATAADGKLYAIGGYNSGACTPFGYCATVEAYDPATNTWTPRAPMPTARAGLALAAAANGKLYAVGGFNGSTLATVEEYDPTTNAWATRAPMPTARHSLGEAAGPNGKLYAIGGYSSAACLPSAYCTTVEEYDPATNTWTPRAPMLTAPAYLGVAAAPNGKLYAMGGIDASLFPVATVEEYDPARNTWALRKSMPTARAYLGVAAAPNGKLYAMGGVNGISLATVEEYDPATDAWSNCGLAAPGNACQAMPTARLGLGLATALNGRLYAMGGYPYQATVEEFTPPDGAPPPTPPITPTQTPTRTSTPTPTSTPIRTPTPTATPYPHQNVSAQVARSSTSGLLQTTITARDAGCPGGNNELVALQFTRLTNARVDIASMPASSITAPTTISLPAHPATVSMTVHRIASGLGATVELTVTDGCGAWPTLVGGGPSSF